MQTPLSTDASQTAVEFAEASAAPAGVAIPKTRMVAKAKRPAIRSRALALNLMAFTGSSTAC
jgi:hypothetical protein